jgi:PASTA domain-containing protein
VDVPSVRERSPTRKSPPPEPVVVKAAPVKPRVAEPPVAPKPAIQEERRPRRSLRRLVVAVALLALIVAAGLVWVFNSDGRSPATGPRHSSSPARPGASSPAAAIPLVVVPDMIGLTATEARQHLIMAGLELAEIRPFVGPPGEVIASQPIAGETVEIGSPVILIVGVEPGRLTSATRSP